MADPIPNQPPAGGVPPGPPEGAKVQPKKETVRIALPPKPTAAPTIKLPSLPPTSGAPTAAPASAPASATAAPTAVRPAGAAPTTQIPRPAAAPTATAPTRPGTTVARPAAAAPAKAPAPAVTRPAAAPRAVGALDTALAVAAMVIGIIALLSVLFLVVGPFESGFLSAIK